MTVVIVQCRLSSSRLFEKALLPLGGGPLLAWTLSAMKMVPADRYFLACDTYSESVLRPLAEECGWECFAGPRDNVLKRFCLLIDKVHADTVVRATADNPFLFYEAAGKLLHMFGGLGCDYLSWTGLPHGSGVEVFDARSLLKAAAHTEIPYDCEHVGPALYNHPDMFRAVFKRAPQCWYHPDLRTTVDTADDYRRAMRVVRAVSGSSSAVPPYSAEEICRAFDTPAVANPVLCVPSVMKGRGTGHLRRCLSVAAALGYDIYIPQDASLAETEWLIEEAVSAGRFERWQIVRELPESGAYAMILADVFAMEHEFAKKLRALAPVAALDEGSAYTDFCDYLIDIIPARDAERKVNMQNPGLIPLPKNRRSPLGNGEVSKVLITLGGEDPAGLAVPSIIACVQCGMDVTAVVSDPARVRERIPEPQRSAVYLSAPVADLKEQLSLYDVVVTHYGFTAFEALAAGCGVILVGTSPVHTELAFRYGFAVLSPDMVNARHFGLLFGNRGALRSACGKLSAVLRGDGLLEKVVAELAAGSRFYCPLCGEKKSVDAGRVIARTESRTFRRCPSCGILYISWACGPETQYDDSYFFDAYQNQYGRSYLEDFETIREQCVRRMSVIKSLHPVKNISAGKHGSSASPKVLDVGCAFGPFLAAADEAGWQVYGTDISREAVAYVQNKLRFPAACDAFPNFDSAAEFGIRAFDAVTMWFVIEHFQKLDAVLRKVLSILKTGGIFAFSTPSASGVSARYSAETFFASSPADHFTLWEPGRVSDILSRYGLKTLKVISTGHHPERFPYIKKYRKTPDSLMYRVMELRSRAEMLGDTFEVYCIKDKEI